MRFYIYVFKDYTRTLPLMVQDFLIIFKMISTQYLGPGDEDNENSHTRTKANLFLQGAVNMFSWYNVFTIH